LFINASCASIANAIVVIDSFSDGNDTANLLWTHLDGAVGSTGQTWDASTGKFHLYAHSIPQLMRTITVLSEATRERRLLVSE